MEAMRKFGLHLAELSNCFGLTGCLILTSCFTCTSGRNDGFNFAQGCISECLNPNLNVNFLLEGRFVSGNVCYNDETKQFPDWANYTLFKMGQKFATENLGAIGLSHLFALIFESFIPDIKETLLVTGSTSSRERASKRYTATAAQVSLWYQQSLDIPAQKRILLNSLEQVRRRHIDASLKVLQKRKQKGFLEKHLRIMMTRLAHDKTSVYNDLRFWSAFKFDLEASSILAKQRKYPTYKYANVPISQIAHVMTQWSFAAMPILFRRQLGINHVSEEELRGFIHVWGVFGYALGVHDEYNICMPASLDQSTKLFRQLFEGLVIPSVFHMDEISHVLASAYLDSLSEFNPWLTPRLVGYKFLRDIMQVKPVRMRRQLNIVERLTLAIVDGLLSDNLRLNKWFANANGAFSLDVNGHTHFGRNFSSIDTRSEYTFYTREKVLI